MRQVVVKSSTTAYGASSRDPAMFTEDMEPRRPPRSGYAKDVNEVERYVRGFARRRSDVTVTLLRCANVIGPRVVSPLASYFRMPVIPTVLGFDPRLQFLHESDLNRVLRHAVLNETTGTFNVAGDGLLMLSQALRRMGRTSVPLPGVAFGGLGSVLRSARMADLSPEPGRLLDLRPRRGHDPDAQRAGLRAVVHHGRGVRRVRRHAAPGHPPRRLRPGRPGRAPAPGRRGPSRPGSPLPEARMADAEIIPIGTRGRPGRGTGTRPSAAARGLAPKSGTPRKPAAEKQPKPERPAEKPLQDNPEDRPVIETASLLDDPAPASEASLPAARTEERGLSPLAGIPVGDWLAAFQHAAREALRRPVGAPGWRASWRSCGVG
ncbi:NAD-dependent epimerase/dehydratase family protein [Nocardioides convexus]|uniref:NAD-dependent epimerase/dehydratase family protein n=1 Tax=Nocardioides convexus TaxID=2712224 RepID=UPI0024187241|nr:NAD-dependent epimerase/dehydratase family protein [Nocardioides convexus]